MAHQHEHITPERLCDAAIAALKAAQEIADEGGGPLPYPADLMGAPNQPECLCAFTRYEIEQASEFLARMGFIEKPARGKAA